MVRVQSRPGRRIGQILIDQGLVTADQLRIGLLEQSKSRLRIGRQLVDLGFIAESALRDALATALGLPAVDLNQVIADPVALEMLPRELATRHGVFPLAYDRKARRFVAALSDVRDIAALDHLRSHLGGDVLVEPRLAGDAEIERAIERHYGRECSIDGILREIETGARERAAAHEDREDAHPVARLVAALLADAVERGASDIHFEPYEKYYRIRLRVDGVLREVAQPPVQLATKLAARLKVMSRLDIAERRVPQDGRIKMRLSKNRSIDFRVSSCPTLFGEKIVLRILDASTAMMGIDALGYEPFQKDLYMKTLARPQGMILVTGPTGSGKTVSLYTGLSILNVEDTNISTAEDPAEIVLPGVNQVNVNPKVGLTFASALRA